MKKWITLFAAVAVLMSAGCTKKDPAAFEKAGGKLDKGIHDAGEKVDKGLNKAGEKIKDVTQ